MKFDRYQYVEDFLSARIAEREAAARDHVDLDLPDPVRVPAVAEHIAFNDPAHVLAECAAQRKIIEMHDLAKSEESSWQTYSDLSDGLLGADAAELAKRMAVLQEMEHVVRLLAAVYAAHPGYNPEWEL